MSICHILHFSPTGGVENVARLVGDAVAQTLGMEAVPCDLAAPHVSWPSFSAGDVILLAAPVYGGRIPGFLAERLEELRPLTNGRQIPAITLVVYGNRAFEDALLELADKATACGLLVMAGMSAVAEHSMCRSVAAGRPDAEDAAALRDFGRQAAEHLRAAPVSAPQLPGQRPCFRRLYGLRPVRLPLSCPGHRSGPSANERPGALHPLHALRQDLSGPRPRPACPGHGDAGRKAGPLSGTAGCARALSLICDAERAGRYLPARSPS